MQNIILPPKVKPNATIGLITPSSPMSPGRLELGIRYLEKRNFNVQIGENIYTSERFLAGSDQQRASDLMRFFADENIQAIMAICGGYGSQRILPYLDFEIIRNNPKWLTGFSDTTALQLGILSQTGLISCTGFTFRDLLSNPVDPLIESSLWSCIENAPYLIDRATPVHPGIATGTLIGGNLSCMMALFGTPYQPHFNHAILFIEDVWAEPYRIDSMLSQLELAGVFNQISGFIWGKFEQCNALQNPDTDGNIEDVISEWAHRIPVPMIKSFPYTHGGSRAVLPIGEDVVLNATVGRLEINRR